MPTITAMLEKCQANPGKWKKLLEARKLEKEKVEQGKKEKVEAAFIIICTWDAFSNLKIKRCLQTLLREAFNRKNPV